MSNNLVAVSILTILFFTAAVIFFVFGESVDHLDPPIVRTTGFDVGEKITISGIAYSDAKVAFYINGTFADEATVSSGGSFSHTLSAKKEGENEIKVKQIYKNISSEFSETLKFNVDLTPPDLKVLEINSVFPEYTNEGILEVRGEMTSDDYLSINGKPIDVGENGEFLEEVRLINGANTLNFALKDSVGNIVSTTTRPIFLDNIPPVIMTSSFCNLHQQASDEYVCITIGDWQGYLDSYNSVALLGSVKGNIKSITVDGKSIQWDENNEIYQRVRLFINGGINKYKVVVEDLYGNTASDYVTTNAERTQQDIDFNLNE